MKHPYRLPPSVEDSKLKRAFETEQPDPAKLLFLNFHIT